MKTIIVNDHYDKTVPDFVCIDLYDRVSENYGTSPFGYVQDSDQSTDHRDPDFPICPAWMETSLYGS